MLYCFTCQSPPQVTTPSSRLAGQLAERGDRLGLFGSVLCALHCALLPVLIALLPTLGLGGASLIDFDQAFTVFATLLGLTTLSLGYRRHRAFHAWMVLIPGLALVWWGSFFGLHDHSLAHVGVMVAGGSAIAAAHLINLRLGHAATSRAFAAQTA
jgi:hypothetical protein